MSPPRARQAVCEAVKLRALVKSFQQRPEFESQKKVGLAAGAQVGGRGGVGGVGGTGGGGGGLGGGLHENLRAVGLAW